MFQSTPVSGHRLPRLLWANLYCLLDTSSGASISARQMLIELQQAGWEIRILGATNFDAEKGMLRLKPHWETIRQHQHIHLEDDDALSHHLVVTKHWAVDEMTLGEFDRWYQLYIDTLTTFQPDVVFFYGGNTASFTISHEATVRGIPAVAYLVNGNYSGERWHRDVAAVVTDTQSTADFYRKKENLSVTPVGTFIVPEQCRVPENSRSRITFINPSLHKGAGIVAQLALLMEKRRPDILFEIVESRGDWQGVLAEVSAAAGELRESLDNVILTHHTDDIRTVYANTRLLLVPSLWWESGARVLAEAMLNGIPTIMTNYGGNREMVEDGGIYFTLAPQFHEAPYTKLPDFEVLEPLVEIIIRLFDDEAYYQEWVERARQVGQKKHDKRRNAKRLNEVLSGLVNG